MLSTIASSVFCRAPACTLLLSLLAIPELASAAPGPGLGNMDCGDSQYFQPFAFIENPQGPNGTNVAVMIRGYFMTIFAPDSGAPPGEIALYDVSDPTAPDEVLHVENADTSVFREAHSLPVALIEGSARLGLGHAAIEPRGYNVAPSLDARVKDVESLRSAA